MVRFENGQMQYKLAFCSNEWRNVPDKCGKGALTWAVQRTNTGLQVKCGTRGDEVLKNINLSSTCTGNNVEWDRAIHSVKVVKDNDNADDNDNAIISWAVSKLLLFYTVNSGNDKLLGIALHIKSVFKTFIGYRCYCNM